MRVMPKLTGRLPGAVTGALGVRPGEKVVAWGVSPAEDLSSAQFTVATDRALYVEAIDERIPWDRISKATWEQPTLDLVLLDDDVRPTRRVRVRIDDAKDLPAAVHDRVMASVVVSERVQLRPGASALFVARRGSDDDAIRWSVVFDGGLDPSDPALRGAADAALSRLRDSLGI